MKDFIFIGFKLRVFVFVLEMGSYYVAQAALKLLAFYLSPPTSAFWSIGITGPAYLLGMRPIKRANEEALSSC